MIHVVFAPRPSLELASLVGGTETAVRLELVQGTGELPFMRIGVVPSAGSWIVSDFSEGALVGSMQLLGDEFDITVNSVEEGRLLLDVIEVGDDEPTYVIEILDGQAPSFVLSMAEADLTVQLFEEMVLDLQFTESIFELPAGSGVDIDFHFEIASMPQRTAVEESSLVVKTTQTVRTN